MQDFREISEFYPENATFKRFKVCRFKNKIRTLDINVQQAIKGIDVIKQLNLDQSKDSEDTKIIKQLEELLHNDKSECRALDEQNRELKTKIAAIKKQERVILKKREMVSDKLIKKMQKSYSTQLQVLREKRRFSMRPSEKRHSSKICSQLVISNNL